jgi:hypothetical protein
VPKTLRYAPQQPATLFDRIFGWAGHGRYSGNPVKRNASLKEAARAGAQSTPANCRL